LIPLDDGNHIVIKIARALHGPVHYDDGAAP